MPKKFEFLKSDWFAGVVTVILFIIFNLASDFMPGLERQAYDMGVKFSSRAPSDKVAVIAIDDYSITNFNKRWPWPRDMLAEMTDKLAAAKAKVIGNTVFFFEPQIDPGLAYINELLKIYEASAPPAPAAGDTPPAAPAVSSELARFGEVLRKAEQALNTDRKLADSITKAGNVVLPMEFQIFEPLGKPDKPLPEYIVKNSLAGAGKAADDLPLPTASVQYPIEILGKAATAIGHLSAKQDVDGGIRKEPLVLRHFEHYFPSLSLMVAAKSLNLGISDIKIKLGEGVEVGKLKIRTDPELLMHTYFYKGREGTPAFQVDSFYDVYTGKIQLSKYQDKIVLIGATAVGVGSTQVTPVSPAMPPVVTLAHTVSSILKEDFFVAPRWADYVEMLIFVLIAAYLIGLLPLLKAGMGAMITGGVFALLLITHFMLMVQVLWLQLMLPATLLLVGHGVLTTKRFLMTERGKIKSEAESAESNRMLGIAYQSQGQLDLAWDKFRKCPLNDEVMENLYSLALDFERKRQFNKSESVFQYMGAYNPKFRDLEQKLARAKAMSETVILGGGGGSSAIGGTVILPGGGVEKPMLGRYQVEKELGKGAMGVVYLGKDPKIGRVVAIKTMALAQEFEADELQEVKERFFREAETAGRLNHPNIVTIYDAGEEHDLAYIAMEFLKGKDLVPYTKTGNLLPAPQLMSIFARVAEALAYAHKQNVVHRDIKPANIMYELESDTVKVTDFGIARITDSSKTKTGMVLGTPSYMSPEQLSGKKVGGHSDLFSLGASLYQMACGKLPFEGDSMAQLMFKIANEPAPDILATNPGLPPCLAEVINRALAKQAEERFQNGEEMAQALRQCAASL